MKTFEEHKEKLLSLCLLASKGKLHFRDLDAAWPKDLAESPLAKIIEEDVEEAVEHFPAKLFSKEPDWIQWNRSEMYLNLLIDIELLKRSEPESVLVAIRQEFAGRSINSGDVEAEVRKSFEKRK